MNTIYRIVWNTTIGKWVVASELAKARGKRGSSKRSRPLLAAGIASLLLGQIAVAVAQDLPYGNTQSGSVNNGTLGSGQYGGGGSGGTPINSFWTSGNQNSNGYYQWQYYGFNGANHPELNGASFATPTGCGTITTSTNCYVDFGYTPGLNVTNGIITPVLNFSSFANMTTGTNSYVAVDTILTGIAPGLISPTSNDAVNGSQLYALSIGSSYHSVNDGGTPMANQANDGATALYSQADGIAASAAGTAATAMGYQSSAEGASSLALGSGATAVTTNDVAIGAGAQASGGSSVAIGSNSVATRANTVSVGTAGSERQITNVAAGTQDTDAVNLSQLDGVQGTLQTQINSLSSTAGLVQQDPATGNITVAQNTNGTTVDMTGTQGTRTVTGVSAGAVNASSVDAINGSQLFGASQSVANALGGGSTVNADGTVSAPTYSLNGGTTTATSVGAAISNIDGRTTQNTNDIAGVQSDMSTVQGDLGSVQGDISNLQGQMTDAIAYDDSTHDSVTLGGTSATAPVALHNVAAGALSATSTDAVNGSQLYATNQQVSQNTADIAGINNSLSNLDSGTVGLVQQDSTSGNITVGKNASGTVVDMTGTQGARTVTGVAAGAVNASSVDAINGSQLFGASQSVANAIGGGSTVNADGTVSAPTYSLNGGTTTVHNMGDAISNIDGRTTQNATDISSVQGDITSITNQLNAGGVGLVQQDPGTGNITVAKNTNGTTVDVSGTDGDRTIAGVQAGVDDDDAVNVAQLKSTGLIDSDGNALSAVTYDPGSNMTSVTLGGMGAANPVLLHNVAAGAITATSTDAVNGAELYALQTQVNQNTSDIAHNTSDIASIAGSNGSNGSNGTSGNNGSNGSESQSGNAVTYDSDAKDKVTLGNQGTQVSVTNVADGDVEAGSSDAVTGNQLYLTNQQIDSISQAIANIDANGSSSVSMGPGGDDPATATGDGSVAVGGGADASGVGSTAIGNGSTASGDNGTALGNGSNASGGGSTSIGSGSTASGDNSTALGNGSNASGQGSTSIGSGSNASGNNSTALGSGSSATGTDSMALGRNASAPANNAVALGSGSVANRDNTVSVGSAGSERQITNVAAGTQATDAVNVGQMQDAVGNVQNWANQQFTQVNRNIDRIGAMSAAYGQMAFSAQGIDSPNKVGVGIGTQNGQAAIAVGYSRQISPRVNLSFGGSASANQVSVGAGLSAGW